MAQAYIRLKWEMVPVLVCLPMKSLLRCRCLSKWHLYLIGHEDFAKEYHQRSAATPEGSRRLFLQFDGHPATADSTAFCPFAHHFRPAEVVSLSRYTVVGSCFGVLCLASTPYEVFLWNPSTRTHRHVSLPNYGGPDGYLRVMFGMGCPDHLTYVVVRIIVSFSPTTREFHGELKVYNSRTDTCETIDDPSYLSYFSDPGMEDRRENGWEFGKSGVCLSNQFLWVAKKQGAQNGAVPFRMMAFRPFTDLKPLVIPDFIMEGRSYDSLLDMDLWPFAGSICISCQFGGESSKAVIWVRNANIWTKLLTVDGSFSRLKPLCYGTEKKNVLLQMDTKLVLYDLERKMYRDISVREDGSLLCGAAAFIDSPILIDGLGRCLFS